MPRDEDDTVVDELLGDGNRLFRVAGVIADDQAHRFTEHPAARIEVGDRHFGAPAKLITDREGLPAHGTGGGDQEFRPRGHDDEGGQNDQCG